MSNPWDNWPKPWTRQQCEIRYVRGDRIGLRKLSEVSGVPYPTLFTWSKDGGFVAKRQQFNSNVMAETGGKTIDLLSDELATELSTASVEHFSAYSDSYWLAREYFAAQKRLALQMNLPDRDRYITGINPVASDKASLILDRAIRGMRMVAGLHYEDYGQAIAFLKRGGYEVVDPSEPDQPTSQTQTEGQDNQQ